jgi:phage tail sheath protein FI
VNHATSGSDLIVATDQLLALTPTQKRPANITSGALAGGGDGLIGMIDADYTGNPAGPTGLYAFNLVTTGRILIVPGVVTEAVMKAMMDYAQITRNGSMVCILDCPASYTAAQMVTFVGTTTTILEYSEFGVMYWPRIKISNPDSAVYGTDDTITVPTSGWIAGLYAKNDANIGGVYESPAGIGNGYGIIRGMLGVEDDPSGADYHEVLDEAKRDLVYPKRINPITKLDNATWHIDGGRTLKSTGSFPNVGERRGVIFIAASIKSSMVIFKHRYNNRTNRKKAERMIRRFLKQEMLKGAFRSMVPDEAFWVDVSDQLNPTSAEFAGIMTIKIGLATNKPTEFIPITITQDTRGLEKEAA